MTKLPKAIMAAAAGVTLLAVSAGPGLAHGMAGRGDTPQMQPAHMGQAYGGPSAAPSYGTSPCPGMRADVGPGMMMGHGSMMGHGMMRGHGMMDHGMMGHGVMGHGSMMGHGMWGGGYGHGPGYGKSVIQPDKDLSAGGVRGRLERSLKWHGNKRLKVGEVKEIDDDTVVAEIVTLEDSLVQRLKIDRHSGATHQVD